MIPEERYQLLIEASSDYVIFFCDAEMHIEEWNSGAERILGYTAEEVIGQIPDFLFTAEDRAAGVPKKEREEALRHGQAIDERWHLKKGGIPLFAQGRLITLRASDGTLHGFAKVLRDWTREKEMQLALTASESKFRSFFELSGAGNAQVDPSSGRIIAANHKFCSMLGYTPEEITSTRFADTIHPEEVEAFGLRRDRLAGGTPDDRCLERRYRRKDGSTLWAHECLTFVPTLGAGRQLFIVLQDITDLKQVEQTLERRVDERTRQLNEKTAHMEELCYTVAHDLRAPLRSVGGYATIVLEDFPDQLPPEAVSYINRIRTSAQNLERLIQDLLSYTRIEQTTIHPVPLSLDDVLKSAAASLEDPLKRREARLTIAPQLGHALADWAALEHVVLNLLSNASKFSRKGIPPVIHVYSEATTDWVTLYVQDNGIGVPEHHRERIFRIFERLHLDQGYSGTGIGLAIVTRAVSRMGGTVGVETPPEGGSRFFVRLPVPT